jgi:hypothetical protein
MLLRTRGHLDGPPLALPPVLDAVAERWWRTRPRTRALLSLGALSVVVLAGVGHAAASPHGPPTGVWLAERDLPVGAALEGGVRRASWPQDLVPVDAVTEPTGTLIAPVPRGAVVTTGHVGHGGFAAGLPAGTAAVALPLDALPALTAGARIDLVVADPDGGGVTVASDAVVLGSDEVTVWVAVDRGRAAQVSGAALHGPIGVVVLPP